MKPEWHLNSVLSVSFAPESKPLVFVNDEFAGLPNVNWP
jgi:hypothetical protein